MSGLRTISGKGTTQDQAGDLANAVKALCYEKAEGMSLAAVIGVLEIVKLELVEDAK